MTRTDLALETREDIARKGEHDGVLFSEESIDGFLCSEVNISSERAQEVSGRQMGRYITIETGKIWLKEYCEFKNAVDLIASKIKELSDLKPADLEKISVLIAGLGNTFITADSIGPKALSKVLITRHLKEQLGGFNNFGLIEISGIAPGVLGQTGMETADIVLAVTEKVKPSLVILIDALASRKITRLATTIQLSNTGISPGSGVGNHRRAINAELLGTPVISLGVPTVVDAATLSYDVLEEAYRQADIAPDERLTREILNIALEESGGNFFVTPKESDLITNEVSKLIGYAINRCFYEEMTFEEMSRIIN